MSLTDLFHKAKPNDVPPAPETLSGDSTVGQWLAHPVGGAIFRDMLQKAGQSEQVLRPVRRMALKRLVALSQGQFTTAMMDDMIERATSGDMPAGTGNPAAAAEVSAESADPPLPEWHERITPDRFAGKTVIVTGAGSGIGRATASRVAREGGRVIAVDISKDWLDDFKKSLPKGNITTVVGDITDDAGVAKIVATAGPAIDGLANVAGIMDNFTPLHEMTDEVWNRVMNVNVLGMMKLSRAVLPKMLASRAGSIVNIGSEASLKASAAGTAYTTSKHAVAGLTKSMAFMYGPTGIRCNVVAPGAVLTNIEAKYESKMGGDRVNTIIATAPEAVEADVLAASITFLLSDDAVNINGAVLPSDGGWSVQ
ncbi:MAG TPA: SDR family oxidoreductase [Candidatus Saccharimonadales bacterium]|nr:SDR family oxidoreductase [Candidatus Saccharimonadales bacterium]